MRAYDLMWKLLAAGRRATWCRERRWSADSLVPRLSITRLEERRVLNADAAPVEVLVVDAGDAADDGQADTFQVEQDADQIRVLVNGEELYATSVDGVSAIHVTGSVDNDVLVADLLAGVQLVFDGGGGNDHLQIQGGDHYDSVGYEFQGTVDGQIDARSADADATVSFRGVEQVTDSLETDVREFAFTEAGSQVTLSEAIGFEGSSRLAVDGQLGVSVLFTNPTDTLRVDTSSHEAAVPDQVEVNGLGDGFDATLVVAGSPHDVLVFAGATDLGAGDLIVSTGSIVLSASLTSEGAQFELGAEESIVVEDHAVLTNAGGQVRLAAPELELAGSITSYGGVVELDSGDEGVTMVEGWIDVSQAAIDGQGGLVHVLGGSVALMAGARINASGITGGGTVLVGGDYQGKNPAIRNASRTFVGSDVSIRADAGRIGNGGAIIVWADDWTRFYGTISARGGADGGDGGFAEVSGKVSLDFAGSVNLGATNGAGGVLLLDPANATIGAADANQQGLGSSANPFRSADGNAFTISAASLIAVIDGGADVYVTTDDGGNDAGAGNITVATAVTPTVGNFDLILLADNNIVLSANIDFGTSGGSGDVVLFADSAESSNTNAGTGAIINGGGTIIMGAGDLQMIAGSGIGTAAAPIQTVGLTDVAAQTGTGGIFLNNSASGAINITSVTTSAGGTTTGLTATTSGDIEVTNTGRDITVADVVTATGGGVEMTGALLDIDANISAASTIDLNANNNVDADADIASSAGDVDIVALGTVDIAAGAQVTAGGGGTTLTIEAAGITLNAGTEGNETVTTTGTGTVALTSSADITLDSFAILIGAGALDVDAGANNIAAVTNAGDEIETDGGSVTLRGTAIGASAGGIDIEVTTTGGTLTVDSNGNGAVDIDAVTANGFSAIIVTQAVADNDIDVQNANVNDVVDIDGAAGMATIVTVDMSTEGATFSYTLSENGSDLVVNTSSITAGDDVSLSSENDITVGSGAGTAIDGSGGPFNVTLTADNDSDGIGRILDGGGSIDTSGGGDLVLHAGSGIGTSTDFLETQSANLDIRNTGSNGVFVENTGNLTLTDLDALPAQMAGGGVIRANSALTINVDPFATGATDFVASNDAATAGDTITINANISHDGNGLLRFLAGDDILQLSGNIQSTGGATNEIHLLANQEGASSGDGDDGGIQQNGGTIATGNLLLSAHEDIQYTQAGNDVAFLAGGVTGITFSLGYRDSDGLTVSTVNAVSGVTTNNGDVKLTVDANDLDIDEDISLGGGNLLLDVAGNVTQQAGDTITAAGLALMVDGTTTLTEAGNDVTNFAADNGDLTLYRDADTLNIESITVDGMNVTAITTSGDDVKLTVDANDLDIDEDISLGSGNLLLDVAGNVTQQAGDTITVAGLALMVDGTTTLDQSNDAVTLAADSGLTILYNDLNDLDVGAVTVMAMTVTGITTDDVTTSGTASGDITVASDTGSITLNANVTTGDATVADAAGVTTATSGSIMLTAATGISGAGVVTTGNALVNVATADAIDTATSGSITLEVTGAGDVGLSGANALTIGNATIADIADNDVATTGNITVTSADRVNNGTEGSPLDVSFGLASGGAANTAGTLSVTTDGGPAAAGEIQITSGEALTLGVLDTDNATVQNVAITVSGGALLIVATASDLDSDIVTLTTDEIDVRDAGGDGDAGATLTAGTITVQPDSAARPIDLGSETAGSLSLTDGELDELAATTLKVGSTTAGAISITAALTPANISNLVLISGSDASQTAGSTITVTGLGLMVIGNVALDQANDVDTFAANDDGTILFNDVDGFSVGEFVAPGMTITGITTSDDDVKLIVGDAAGENLAINQAINLGAGDLFLDVAGNVTQTATGTITTNGLALMVDGTTTLDQANDADILAADTADTILYNDVDDLTVGTVTALDGTADQMTITGITTTDDDVKLIGVGITIDETISVGAGDLGIVSSGAVTQTVAVTGTGLLLMGGGPFTLTSAANNFDTIAADTTGTVNYTNADALAVGTVTALDGTADQMSITGITTTDDDVKLIVGDAAGENLAINQAINLGAGDLFLDVAGNVTQTATGTITTNGLALMVDGTTTLDQANDADILAADTADTILYNDVDDLTVGTVTALDGTADQMTITGITTSDDDVKLIGVGITIDETISVGAGDLGIVSSGAVTQTVAVTGTGLLLMGGGPFTLTSAANNFDTIAADTTGTVNYTNADALAVGTVTALDGTADQMSITGITTTDDDVKLIVGDAAGENLAINQAINLGAGDLFLDVAGNVTQTATGTITTNGLALMVDGTTTLDQANDADILAADTADTILYNDVDDLTVGTVTALDGTADQMTITGITTSDDDVKLIVGDAAGENLAINQAINLGAGDLFLDVAGNVTQTATGTITTNGLALMVDGTTTLDQANDADILAADTADTILYNDVDDLTVGTVTALDGTADQMTITGITTSDDDVKLIGVGITIDETISVGAGDLGIVSSGAVTQTVAVTGTGLLLMGGGPFTLTSAANNFDTIAADTTGTVNYTNADALAVGTVTALDGTADQMSITGITTTDDDVKLIVGDAAGENLAINQAINLGAGDLFLDVAGNVTQTATGTITTNGLALMVDGTTTLDQANDADILAADTADTILYNDVDDLTVGTVTALDGTADQMTITGITTSDDDVKLIVGDAAGENLAINQAINLGAGDLFLDVAGNVTQTATGTITTNGLALMVDGTTTLDQANDADILAADTTDTILYNDVDVLTVGTVTALDGTADQMTITGITTINGDVSLNAGDTVQILADVDAMSGIITVAAGSPTIDAITLGAGVELTASGGTISDQTLQIDMVLLRFTALDISAIDPDTMPLTNGSTAFIDVDVLEAAAMAIFQIQVDWRESTGDVSNAGAFYPIFFDPGFMPGDAADDTARVIQDILVSLQGMYQHVYEGSPDGDTTDFIYVPVRISQIAPVPISPTETVATINFQINGVDLLEFEQAPGTLGGNLGATLDLDGDGAIDPQVGIVTVIAIPVLEFDVALVVPLPETLPVVPPVAPPLTPVAAPAEPVPMLAEAPPLPNTAGLTAQAEQRYYELRIVSFDADGGLLETPEQRIDLSDPRLEAIAPFDPSKLPKLFKRLPGDRYRIYLIEDGAERLMIEFVIERVGDEGRPVELPERIEQAPQPAGEPADAANPEARGARRLVPPDLDAPERDDASFAAQLGRASFVSSSGLLFGAALLCKSAKRRREAEADRRMTAFRKRLRTRGTNPRREFVEN